ncbi:hypothetical protein RRG08_006426 [Elysia crispata]|uniref:Uncharacterized protein n=1 Tax=Elysia crispata TaxID=231223 RepID=A0AAE1ABJ9_9GAST|nr:hypothetical protein RRG08_006426 [Elysia crispata]
MATSAAAQVDDSSRRELIAAIDKAIDLKEQVDDRPFSAYNGTGSNEKAVLAVNNESLPWSSLNLEDFASPKWELGDSHSLRTTNVSL